MCARECVCLMSSRLLAEASAGAAGQLVATLLLHPLDTLKTRKQASNANVESLSVRVLYKGLPPKALLSLLSSFVFFYGYEFYKGVLRRARVPLSAIINVFVASTFEFDTRRMVAIHIAARSRARSLAVDMRELCRRRRCTHTFARVMCDRSAWRRGVKLRASKQSRKEY